LRLTDGRKVQDAACGDGPVDAVFKTIERITGVPVRLRDFKVRSVTVGEDAQGEAQIEVEHNSQLHRGRAVSTDIVEASALAFLKVINRIATRRQPQKASEPQPEMAGAS
jgi:2-isopropylmalate synthase